MSLFDDEDQPEETGMSEDELCQWIEDCLTTSIGYSDSLKDDRVKAFDFYVGNAVGDLSPPEVDGRSSVVSRDMMDTIEWIMPSMMRIFAGTENVVSFEATKPGQEHRAAKATTYCNYTLHKKNRGFNILHDAIKSALIERVSYAKVWSEEETEDKQEEYTGISAEQFQVLQQCPGISIISVQQGVDDYTQQPVFDVLAMRTMSRKVTKIVSVPQNELFIDSSAKDDESACHAIHEREITVSDLIAMGYPRDIVEDLPSSETRFSNDESRRRDASGLAADLSDKGRGAMRRVTLQECYLKVDFDGDGIAEWRRIHKAGNKILLNEYCDGHPFASCSAILMPYSYVGLSIYDLLRDIQRIKTTLQRQMLDNMYLITNARTEVVDSQVNLDDLLNPRPGGIVRVKQAGAMREIMPPPISGEILNAINHFDHVRQVRTGVTEYASATNADSISKSSGVAVDMLQSAAKERIELMARVIGETFITRLYKLILKCALQNSDSYDQIYINGELLDIDPREWQEQYNMSVSVGLGTQSRGAQVAQWQQILMAQRELLPIGIVRPEHIANAAKSLIEAMGHKDVGRYMVDPTKEAIQPLPPPPDPNASKFQIEKMKLDYNSQLETLKHQLEQQKIQSQAQLKQAEQLWQAQQNQHQQQLEAQRAELQAQRDYELQLQKERHDYQIALMNDATKRYGIDVNSDTQIITSQIGSNSVLTAEQIAAEQIYDSMQNGEPYEQ